MQTRSVLSAILLVATTSLTGCAAYTVASTASYIATDKTLTDHGVTLIVPNGDCNATHLFKGQYYCELRDASVTYNRNAF